MGVDDEATLAQCANTLADAFEECLGPWVMNAIALRHPDPLPPAVLAMANEAEEQARTRVAAEIRDLLETDIDAQHTSPLALARQVVPLATQVLDRAGVVPVPRDRDAERLHPDDVYDLTPGTFGDFGDALHEPGITWGAAKAYVHLSRRKAEGRR